MHARYNMQFADVAHDTWVERYGFKPPWTRSDYVLLAKAKTLLGSRAELAWRYYLSVDEEWIQGHSPRKFIADLSRWAVGGEGSSAFKMAGKEFTISGWQVMDDGRLRYQEADASYFIDPRGNPERFYSVRNGEFGDFASLEPGTAKKLKRHQFKQRRQAWGGMTK